MLRRSLLASLEDLVVESFSIANPRPRIHTSWSLLISWLLAITWILAWILDVVVGIALFDDPTSVVVVFSVTCILLFPILFCIRILSDEKPQKPSLSRRHVLPVLTIHALLALVSFSLGTGIPWSPEATENAGQWAWWISAIAVMGMYVSYYALLAWLLGFALLALGDAKVRLRDRHSFPLADYSSAQRLAELAPDWPRRLPVPTSLSRLEARHYAAWCTTRARFRRVLGEFLVLFSGAGLGFFIQDLSSEAARALYSSPAHPRYWWAIAFVVGAAFGLRLIIIDGPEWESRRAAYREVSNPETRT